MRITESMITRGLLVDVNDCRVKMNESQKSISTGKAIRKVSDDPARFTKASNLKEKYSRNEQYLQNIQEAIGWVDNTSTLLEDIYSLSLEAQEVVNTAANLTSDSNIRQNLASQVDSTLNEMLTLTNSKYLDKYVFGGNQTKGQTPFSLTEDGAEYTGNANRMYRKVADNAVLAINVSGERLLEIDPFTPMIELKSALEQNDTEKINELLDTINTLASQLSGLCSECGTIKNQLLLSQNRLETANLNLETVLSNLEDADMATAITRYNTDELAYQSALQVISDVINNSLLNFLG